MCPKREKGGVFGVFVGFLPLIGLKLCFLCPGSLASDTQGEHST